MQNPLSHIAQQIGVKTSDFDYDHIVLYDLGGIRLSEEEFAKKYEDYAEVYATIGNLGIHDKSFYH